LEQAPVGFRKPLEELADFEVVSRHSANLGDELFANIFGHGLLLDLGGEMEAALRGILMKGSLKEVESVGDLT
jgi:hypothetical protein